MRSFQWWWLIKANVTDGKWSIGESWFRQMTTRVLALESWAQSIAKITTMLRLSSCRLCDGSMRNVFLLPICCASICCWVICLFSHLHLVSSCSYTSFLYSSLASLPDILFWSLPWCSCSGHALSFVKILASLIHFPNIFITSYSFPP